MFSRKAQSIIEFSTLVILVVAGIVLMRPYLLRAINAQFKSLEEGAEESVRGPIVEADYQIQNYPTVCGNGILETGEQKGEPNECCQDFDQAGACGDDVCCSATGEDDETNPATFCAADCCGSAVCSDTICDTLCGEDRINCPQDCWACQDGFCDAPYEDYCACAPGPSNDCFCVTHPFDANLANCNVCLGENTSNCGQCHSDCAFPGENCTSHSECCSGSCDTRLGKCRCPQESQCYWGVAPRPDCNETCYLCDMNGANCNFFCGIGTGISCHYSEECCGSEICLKPSSDMDNNQYGRVAGLCGEPSWGTCGNWSCDDNEDCSNCMLDCRGVKCHCGNGIEEPGETCTNCPADVLNGICEADENYWNCRADCPDECGDGYCDPTENDCTCDQDCGQRCGDGCCTPIWYDIKGNKHGEECLCHCVDGENVCDIGCCDDCNPVASVNPCSTGGIE